MSKSTGAATAGSDAQALLDMFRRIPVALLETTALDLLKATRRIRLSKDHPEGAEEPDYAVRLKCWQTIVEQRVGAAASRKPLALEAEVTEERPSPGLLKPRKAGRAGDSDSGSIGVGPD